MRQCYVKNNCSSTFLKWTTSGRNDVDGAVWYSANVLDLYLNDACFVFWSGHRFFWLTLCGVSLSIQENPEKIPLLGHGHFIRNLTNLLSNYLAIWLYIVWVTDCIFRWTAKKVLSFQFYMSVYAELYASWSNYTTPDWCPFCWIQSVAWDRLHGIYWVSCWQ